MPKFPSVEWFEAVSERTDKDRDKFRVLGYVDADVGIIVHGNRSGVKSYLLKFRDYGVESVAEAASLDGADFALEGSLDAWTDMVRNITEKGEADIDHSLNRLAMAGTPLKVVATDQLKADIFSRFNQSFQAFFNEASTVPTEFAANGG